MRIHNLPPAVTAEHRKFLTIPCIQGDLESAQILSSALKGRRIAFDYGGFPGTIIPPPDDPISLPFQATLEVAVNNAVTDIFVIGHSSCKALTRLTQMQGDGDPDSALDKWLKHAPDVKSLVGSKSVEDADFVDQLSKANLAFQLTRLSEYPQIAAPLRSGVLFVHGLWFDHAAQESHYVAAESFCVSAVKLAR